ncbi:hypothetical protein QOZ80_6BG0457870 [Eleusine coracana subsp. coracana]|nr:hypothetical protein QOZ80_6BG0457870 [Eleusine coracana subsp. coracana]
MSSEASEPKKMKIVYSRDFLLSFGELEHCKKLPADFDSARLSDLQELSAGGRWDTRSTGSSDRDGELPDREYLTQDRRNATQYRRSWQNTEHDGLLGSGGFPRPSGYAGQLASKDHGTAYQINRTSQRYQPPRPYKKDIDSINDETFGSSEYSNEDRAEEEKKRRASFELMRKEQHKAMQGKKAGPDILKENPSDDIISQLQTSTEKANTKAKNEKLDVSAVSSIYQESATKISSVLPAPAARPLVPPGFANAFVEKKLQPQSSNISLEPKGHNATIETNIATIARAGHQLEGNKSATEITECESKEKDLSGHIANLGSGDWEAGVMDKYSIEKEGKSKSIDPVRKDSSVSMLEQFFGNALSKGGSNLPTYVEIPPVNIDDDIVSSVPESSKFSRCFLDEDSKPAEDLSSKSLLSMIVKNENPEQGNVVHTSSDGGVQNLSPRSPIGKFDSGPKFLSFTSPSPTDGILKQHNPPDVPETVPVMMTCEDLEQAMLEQVKSDSGSSQKNAIQEHPAVVNEPIAMHTQKAAVDNHASHHLLSLLQKGTDSKGSSSLGFQIGSEEPQSVEVNSMTNGRLSGSGPVDNAESATSGKNLTLEALFGAAFMSELHSKDAPVSIRGSATGGPSEFAETGKTQLPSGHELFYPVEPALHVNSTKDDALKELGSEYRSSALPGPNQGNPRFEMKGLEIQLPEEDNLFTMNDSLPGQNSDILPSVRSSRIEGLLPDKAVDDLSFRLQTLVAGAAEHNQVLRPDAHSREQRYQAESQNLYHLLQGRPPMMAHHPIVDHAINRNQHVPFDVPQPTHHHRSYPANVNSMQNALHGPGVPHMDPAAHHLMLQHMSMPGSFPPEGLPRGVPPSQPAHHMPGYRPEMSNVNNFHMHPRQPNYGDFGLMAGPEVRGNHPGAFERLMQMEMSARSKQQVHPAMAGPVPGGMHGHELDMNLRFR